MNTEDIKFVCGENSHQNADIEQNDKMIDYEIKGEINYINFLSILKGLDIVSEFYDVKCACTLKGSSICAVALGQSLADAVQKALDSNPIEFMASVIVVSSEVDSETVRFLKDTNVIVAPKYTAKALEYLDTHNITYVTITTPLNEYKNFKSNDIKVTPLGTLVQTPNFSELDKDKFKVISKTKPSVEDIEDAVFAWKVAKYCNSQAMVIAKDLKTTAISQGLQSTAIEFVLDYACDGSKHAILASDMPVTVHDVDAAAQGRINLIIVPCASKEIITKADKYEMAIIETGITNILY